MNTKIWGPPLWKSLHFIAEGYPENPTQEDKEHYLEFFKSIRNILPCRYCRESYSIFIKQIPPDPYMFSRDHLTYWVYIMHNRVNEKLEHQNNKKIKVPTYEIVRKEYSQWRVNSDTNKKKKRGHL